MDVYLVGFYLSSLHQSIYTTLRQLSVFTADALIGMAGIISAKWVKDGKCQVGPSCTAQGWSAIIDILVFKLTNHAAIFFGLGSITVALNIVVCNLNFISWFW